MIHVTGIDSSLSETGIVVIRGVDGRPIFDSATAPTPPSKEPNAEQELARIRTMASRTFTRAVLGLDRTDQALFVIEGPSMHGIQGKADERSGLRWVLINALARAGHVVEVPPKTVKSYWTGNGNADKKMMIDFAQRRYPEFPGLKDDNVVDALALAHLGAMHLGLITEPRAPGVNLKALEPVRWPL